MDASTPHPGKTDSVESSRGSYQTLVWGFAALAVGLRVYHYLRNPPVWCDELWLLRNITGKSFVEQLGPLSDVQACPPLFLWVERLIWLVFGNNIFALRLIPLLASCGTLLLLIPLGRYCLRAAALPWALLLLGCCDKILDYTCDVKPYTTDAFLAIGVATLFCSTQHWRLERRLSLFALLAPLVIFLSYPGCFVCGGLLIAFLCDLWTVRRLPRAWICYGLLALSTFSAFMLLQLGPIRAQHTAALNALWVDYPDWHQPWAVPWWTAEGIMKLLEHLWRPTGMVLLVPIVFGSVSLWRRSKKVELLLLVAPGSLAMLAAWLHTYPFESRLMLFAAAPLALLAGEGMLEIVGHLRRALDSHARAASPAMRMLVVASVTLMVVLVLVPFSRTIYFLGAPRQRLTIETWPEKDASEGQVSNADSVQSNSTLP